MTQKAKDVLATIFDRPKAQKIRGRGEIRRPKRSEREGYTGRGYKGKDGQMQGKWQSGELKAPDIPQAPKGTAKKKRITEFEDENDWILSMILVAIMHGNPGLSPDEAVEEARKIAKRLYLPNTRHIWRRQVLRIKRRGVRAEASAIRREMYKLI